MQTSDLGKQYHQAAFSSKCADTLDRDAKVWKMWPLLSLTKGNIFEGPDDFKSLKMAQVANVFSFPAGSEATARARNTFPYGKGIHAFQVSPIDGTCRLPLGRLHLMEIHFYIFLFFSPHLVSFTIIMIYQLSFILTYITPNRCAIFYLCSQGLCMN